MVTVDEAISKGHRMVNYPVSIPSMMIFVITYYMYIEYQIPIWGILVCFATTAISALLLRSYVIVKWQIWAFDNVRNVHELKKRAIQERLIRSNKSIFEKNSIFLSASDKEKLSSISYQPFADSNILLISPRHILSIDFSFISTSYGDYPTLMDPSRIKIRVLLLVSIMSAYCSFPTLL
jgi:hypothetical protein